MPWFKAALLSTVLFGLPVFALADIASDMAGSSGSSTSGTTAGLKFDPADNPKTGFSTIKRLTFLTGADDPVSISIRVINLALSLLGLASMIMLLYAGVKWFLARDNEEEVTKAKDIIKGAIIGLCLTLGALGLAQLLFTQLVTVTIINT